MYLPHQNAIHIIIVSILNKAANKAIYSSIDLVFNKAIYSIVDWYNYM